MSKYTQEQLDAVIHEGPLGFKVNALAAALLDARAELGDSRELHAKTVADLRRLSDAMQESLIGTRQQRDSFARQLREVEEWLTTIRKTAESSKAKLDAVREWAEKNEDICGGTHNELLAILGDEAPSEAHTSPTNPLNGSNKNYIGSALKRAIQGQGKV